MISARAKEIIIAICCVAFIMLVMVYVKVYYGSYKEFYRGEESYEKQDWEEAILHYDRSIHWYTPYNNYVKRSAERLWEIGEMAEAKEDRMLALDAYESLRSSFYAVRSTYTPGKDWIEKCDEKIATLRTMEEPYGEEEKKKSHEQRRAEHLALLKKDTAPDVFWSIFLEIGFLGWIGCTIGFIFRVFEGEKGFNSRRALFWGSLVIVFYAMWIIGMVKA